MKAYLGDQFALINDPISASTPVRPFEACCLSGQTLNKAASFIHGRRNKKQLLFLALSLSHTAKHTLSN